MPQIVRSPNGCTGCGACLREGQKINGFDSLVEASIGVCPKSLVRRCGEECTDDEIEALIKKNVKILNSNGGGVTFSGGEPLAQPEFLISCLNRLEGLTHRAVQTSGYAAEETFSRVIEAADYFLYDLKLINDELHRKFTGASNRLILSNFGLLAKSGKPFCVRIPLIPTVNDTEKNLTQTAELLEKYGIGSIDILPYNRMAGGKYAMTGREYSPGFDGQAEPAPHREIFDKFGIEVNIL